MPAFPLKPNDLDLSDRREAALVDVGPAAAISEQSRPPHGLRLASGGCACISLGVTSAGDAELNQT